jgi:hypothetical protein
MINILYLSYGVGIGNVLKHCHNGSYELHFIPSGQGTVYINDEKYDIIPGSLYMTGPGVIHEQISKPSNPMSEFCISLEFASKTESSSLQSISNSDVESICQILKNTTFWYGRYQNECNDLFNKMTSEVNNKYIGYYEMVKDVDRKLKNMFEEEENERIN